VHAARAAGADVVIAVMVDRELTPDGNMATAQGIIQRAGEIAANTLEATELAVADVVIRPDVGDLHWMDFSRAGELVRKGEEATHAALKQIDASLPLYRRISRLGRRIFKG